VFHGLPARRADSLAFPSKRLIPRGFPRFDLMPGCKCEGLHTVKNANFRSAFYLYFTDGYMAIPKIHTPGIKMAMTWLLSDVSSHLVVILEAGP